MTTDMRIMAHPLSCVFDHSLPETPARTGASRNPRVDTAPHDAVEIVAGPPTERARDSRGISDHRGDVARTTAGDRHPHAPPGEPGNGFEDVEDAEAAPASHVQHACTAAGIPHVPHGGAVGVGEVLDVHVIPDVGAVRGRPVTPEHPDGI